MNGKFSCEMLHLSEITDSVFSPFQHITSLLLDLLALLGSHPLVGQGDHLGQGLALHLGQVASQLPVPGRVGPLD